MAQIYAGILGPLAFVTAIVRGMIHGGGADEVLPGAWCCLLLFAVAGAILGLVGEWVVEDAVRTKIRAELAAQETAATESDATPAAATT